jgi:small-conductance mechanosensitive channel
MKEDSLVSKSLRLTLVVLSLLGGVSHPIPLRAQEPAPVPALAVSPEDVDTAPVVIDGQELFRVRGFSTIPAADRARRIAGRIEDLASDPSVAVDSVSAAQSERGLEIVVGTRVLMTVHEADAKLEGVTPTALASAYVARIRESVAAFRHDRSASVLLRSASISIAALVALGLILWALRRLFRTIEASIDRRYGDKIRSLHFPQFPIVQADRLWTAIQRSLRSAHALIALVAIVTCLEIILEMLPWTRPIARGAISYLLDPLRTIGSGILGYVPKLIFLLVLAIVTRWVLTLVRLFFGGIERGTIEFRGFDPDWAPATYKLARFFLLAFALVVAYPLLPGSESAAFKGVSLFVGVMLSLGSSSAISNLIAGYSMTYRRAFKLGDVVKIGEQMGVVSEMRLLVTHLKSIKHEEIVIPNSLILNSHVVNYSSVARRDGLILHTSVGIGYETPWRQVEAMLLLAAERTPGLRADPQPFVLQRALGDFAVTYELNVGTDDPKSMMRTYTDLHRNILDVFNQYGVQIMTPAYEGDPETPKIVPNDQWYQAPARPPESDGKRERGGGS